MDRLMTVALIGGGVALVLGGFLKMLYQLKLLACQPRRPRQPWEYEPR